MASYLYAREKRKNRFVFVFGAVETSCRSKMLIVQSDIFFH